MHKTRHTPTPQSVLLNSQIKCLNTIIKNLISMFYNLYYNLFKNIKPDNILYKNVKKFSHYKASAALPAIISNPLSNRAPIFQTNTEKANTLGAHFENIHRSTTNPGDQLHKDYQLCYKFRTAAILSPTHKVLPRKYSRQSSQYIT